MRDLQEVCHLPLIKAREGPPPSHPVASVHRVPGSA